MRRSRGKIDLFLWYFILLQFYVFLHNFEKTFLQISIWYFSSWKIICVLAQFWESSAGNVLRVLVHFPSPEIYMFCSFLVLLENWSVLIKECLILENSYFFLLHPSLLENVMCSRNLFKVKVQKSFKCIFLIYNQIENKLETRFDQFGTILKLKKIFFLCKSQSLFLAFFLKNIENLTL